MKKYFKSIIAKIFLLNVQANHLLKSLSQKNGKYKSLIF